MAHSKGRLKMKVHELIEKLEKYYPDQECFVEAGYKQYEIDYIDDSNDGLEVVLITGWEKDEDAE